MPVALITGGSTGLGRAVVRRLVDDDWAVIADARDADLLREFAPTGAIAIPGDVTDAGHRADLVAEVARHDRLDLLVHNASTLGRTPLPRLEDVAGDDLPDVMRVNAGAPLVLTGQLLPWLVASSGTLVSISSDVVVDHEPGWGLYGLSKAAMDHVTLQYGAENPEIAAYAVDPGDMRTAMHQAAFPGEDISDRPLPETVVPHLLGLLAERPPNGRYRAADFGVSTSSTNGVGSTNGIGPTNAAVAS